MSKYTLEQMEEAINNSCMAISMSILDKETKLETIMILAEINEILNNESEG